MSTTNEKKSDDFRLYEDDTEANPQADTEDFDQYGVWVKAGPETVEDDSADMDGDFELSDLSETNTSLTPEEEELLGSLESESADDEVMEESLDLDLDLDDIPELDLEDSDSTKKPSLASAPEDDLDFSLEEEPFEANLENDLEFSLETEPLEASIEDDLEFSLEEEPLEEETEIAAKEEAPVEFNDLEAVELDMTDEPVAAPQGEANRDILSKIERELAAIKEELAELKRELSVLRPAAASKQPSPSQAEKPEEPADAEAGFFDEDEDETIALTGDELDNILNTADITEEKGESDIFPEDMDLESEALEENLPFMGEELSPEEPDIPGPVPVTTPEEQAIIEEYNRELDEFGTDDFNIEDEDALDEQSVSALPEDLLEQEDLLDLDAKEPSETIVTEMHHPEEVPYLNDLVMEEEPLPAEDEAFVSDRSSEPADIVEFDLDSLDEVEEPEVASEVLEGFEEELEEIEVAIPEEEESLAEEVVVPLEEEESLAEEVVVPLEEEESLVEEVVVPLEEEELVLHIPEQVEEEELLELEEELEEEPEEEALEAVSGSAASRDSGAIPENLREEIMTVLKYMDNLLESLPEEKIQEFAHSEHFEVYRRLFEELGLE